MYVATMRVGPVQRSSVQGLTAHNMRTEEYAAKTSHIDPGRVKDNQVLVGTADPAKDLEDAIEGIPMARKGKKETGEYVGAELILTAKSDYFKDLTPEQFQEWTENNLAWLRQEFDQAGRGCFVNAVLHLDEEAPHIHAVIAPVIQKSRKHPVTKELMPAKAVLNYSAIFGDRMEVLAKARKEGRSHLDTQLGRMQTSYAQAMQPCGLVRGRESMRTKARDVKHVAPHLYREIKPQLESMQEAKAQIEEELEQTMVELTKIDGQRKQRLKEFAELESAYITTEEIRPRILEKRLLGTVTESPEQIAHRLNREHIEPIAVSRQQLHETQRELEIAKRFNRQHAELTEGLNQQQLLQLRQMADTARAENQTERERSRPTDRRRQRR